MPFQENLIQAIAQAKANAQPRVQQQQPTVLRGGGTTKTTGSEELNKRTYDSFESVGKQIGELMYKQTPEYKKFESEQARSVFASMDERVQKAILTKPEVQKKFKEYEAANPSAMLDAGELYGDESLKGYLAFAPIAQAKAELEQKQAQVKETQARTTGLEAATAQTKQTTQQEAELHPINVKQKKQELELTRSQTAQSEAQTQHIQGEEQRAGQKHPLEMDLLQVHAGYYRSERDKNEKELVNKANKGVFDTRKNLDDNLIDQYSKGLIQTEDYAVKDVQATKSMVTSLGYTQLPSMPVPIPTAAIEPQAVQWVNKSVNEAFMAVFMHPEMDPQTLKNLYREIDKLYNSVYGFADNLEVQKAAPGIQSVADPDLKNKLDYIEYFAMRDMLTEDQDRAARRELAKSFKFPDLGDPKSFLFWKWKGPIQDLEQSTLPGLQEDQTGQHFKISQ